MRTEKYRYVMWMADGFTSEQPFSAEKIYGIELYDFEKDPKETVNVARDNHYASVQNELYKKMITFFKSQEKISK
jgi:arylsulfatase A-like enzyme